LWGDDADSDSDEEEHFQEVYEESFIDDDEEVGGGPGSDIDPAILPPSLDDDEEDEDDEAIEAGFPAVAHQRIRHVPIVISSDEEDDGDYTDADTHGANGRSWNGEGEEDGGYHDVRSDSDDRGDNGYWSDEGPHDDGSFYGYL